MAPNPHRGILPLVCVALELRVVSTSSARSETTIQFHRLQASLCAIVIGLVTKTLVGIFAGEILHERALVDWRTALRGS